MNNPLSFGYNNRPLSYLTSQKYSTCPSFSILLFFLNPIPPPLSCNIFKLLFSKTPCEEITHLTDLMKLSPPRPAPFTSNSDTSHFSNYISLFYESIILLPLVIQLWLSFTCWWYSIVDSGVHPMKYVTVSLALRNYHSIMYIVCAYILFGREKWNHVSRHDEIRTSCVVPVVFGTAAPGHGAAGSQQLAHHPLAKPSALAAFATEGRNCFLVLTEL